MRKRTTILAALAVAGLLSGCARRDQETGAASASSSTSISTTTVVPPTSAVPGATPACTPAVAPTTAPQTIDSAGGARTFLVDQPEADGAAHPILLSLHGLGGNEDRQTRYTQLGAQGVGRGYVVLTPQALGSPAMWTVPPLPGTDDVHFLEDAVAWAGANVCGDTAHVYVAGISNGASMTGGMSCRSTLTVRAMAMVAGPNAYPPCTDRPPVPLVSFHGTADPLVPYDGGPLFGASPAAQQIKPNATKITVKPAEQQLAGWAQRNGCAEGPTTTPVRGSVSEIAYTSCAGGADTVLYRIDGGGHTWPGAISANEGTLGPTTHDIDATAIILDFFDAHR